MEKKTIGVKEAAVLLGVSSPTIRRAIKANRLKSFQLSKRGVIRIPLEEIEKLIKEHKT
jgi:excisionase family DNA binding protein